jgi:glycine reductase
MVKEIERTGMPVVIMCNLTNIAKTVGSNRIVPTFAVPYPLGNPQASPEEEWAMRLHRVETAVKALQTPVSEQTIFPVQK